MNGLNFNKYMYNVTFETRKMVSTASKGIQKRLQKYHYFLHDHILITRALDQSKALGKPETKCLLICFCEEQSKASLIGAFEQAL